MILMVYKRLRRFIKCYVPLMKSHLSIVNYNNRNIIEYNSNLLGIIFYILIPCFIVVSHILSKSDSLFPSLWLNAVNGIAVARVATQINFRAIMVQKHIANDYDNASTKTEHNVYIMSFINKTNQMPSQLVCEQFVSFLIFYVCLR